MADAPDFKEPPDPKDADTGADGDDGGADDDAGKGGGGRTKFDDLPQEARDEIRRLRNEAAQYRTKNKELEPLAKKARELDEAGKSDLQRANDLAASEKSRADTAESKLLRYEVAIEKGLSMSAAKRLVGSTREELEQDADDYLEEHGGSGSGGGDGDSKSTKDGKDGKRGGGKSPLKRKPAERLRGGQEPEGDDDDDEDASPAELAKRVLAKQGR